MIIGYLDASDRNVSVEEQRQIVEQYAHDSNLVIDVYSSDEMSKLIYGLQTSGHTLILANIVGLGNSLNAIKDNIKLLLSKGSNLISIKEDLVVKPNQEIEWLIKGMELSIDIRNSMVSTITKKALDDKKSKGYKLGREFGSKNKKKIWEGKEEEIKQMLLSGYSRKQTAEEVGISTVSLYNYIKQNPELKQTLAQS